MPQLPRNGAEFVVGNHQWTPAPAIGAAFINSSALVRIERHAAGVSLAEVQGPFGDRTILVCPANRRCDKRR